jgi:hypothetical protein
MIPIVANAEPGPDKVGHALGSPFLRLEPVGSCTALQPRCQAPSLSGGYLGRAPVAVPSVQSLKARLTVPLIPFVRGLSCHSQLARNGRERLTSPKSVDGLQAAELHGTFIAVSARNRGSHVSSVTRGSRNVNLFLQRG